MVEQLVGAVAPSNRRPKGGRGDVIVGRERGRQARAAREETRWGRRWKKKKREARGGVGRGRKERKGG